MISNNHLFILLLYIFNSIIFTEGSDKDSDAGLLLFQPRPISSLFTGHIGVYLVTTKDGNLGYLTTLDGWLVAIDFTEKTSLQILSQIFVADSTYDLKITNDEKTIFVVASNWGTKIYDCSNPKKIKYLAEYNTLLEYKQSSSLYIYNDQNHVIVGFNGGVYIINATNRSNPIEVTTLQTQGVVFWNIDLTKDERFIFIAEGGDGVAILDGKDKTNLTEVARVKGVTATCVKIHPDPNQTYFFFDDETMAIWTYDYSQVYSDQLPTVLNKFSSSMPLIGGIWYFSLSHDGNFLLVATRPYGISVIDLRDRSNMQQVQFIQMTSDSYMVSLSFDSQYLYFTSGSNLILFKRDIPNLNKDKPNLMHSFQSYLIPKIEPPLYTIGLKLVVSFDQKYIFAVNQVAGFDILDARDQFKIKRIMHVPAIVEGQSVEGISQSPSDNNVLYVTHAFEDEGVYIYNISNITQLELISTVEFPNDCNILKEFEPFNSTSKVLIIGCIWDGMLVINVTDIKNPVFLGVQPSLGAIVSFTSSKGQKYIYTANTDYGLIIYNIEGISDNTGIKFINSSLLSSPQVIKTSKDYQYLFVIDGVRGFMIYNLSNEENPKLISATPTGGWASDFCLTKTEEYVYVTMSDGDSVSLLDIRDKQRPKVLQAYSQDLDTMGCALSNSDGNLLMQVSRGIRVLPLSINHAIQTTFYEEQSTNMLLPKQNFTVGQSIDLYFTPLYFSQRKKIVSIEYTSNIFFKNVQLNIEFGKRNQYGVLNMLLVKENTGENTLMVYNVMQVQKNDFILNQLGFNVDDSTAQKILGVLINLHYLDAQYYPTDEVNENIVLESQLPSDLIQYLELIKNVLQNRVFLFPSYFYVIGSLYFTPFQNGSQNIISTLSKEISMSITVEKAIWFKQQYEGVLVSFNKNSTTIFVSGKANTVNQVLPFLKLTTHDIEKNILVSIMIDDGINYIFEKQYYLSEFNYMIRNHYVERSQNLLQKQFENEFPNSQIYIEQVQVFQFAKDTFLDEDPLEYSAMLKNGDDYNSLIPIPSDFWAQFIVEDRKFEFSTTKDNWLESATIVVIASDGYTEIQDEFLIKVDLIPFSYVGNYLITAVSILVGIIGSLKYRAQLYGIFFKSKYSYGKDVIYVGDVYKKQTAFIFNEAEKCTKLLELMQQKCKKQNINFFTYFINEHTGLLNQQLLIHFLCETSNEEYSRLLAIEQKNQKKKQQENSFQRQRQRRQSKLDRSLSKLKSLVLVDQQELQDEHSTTRFIVTHRMYKILMKENKDTEMVYKSLINRSMVQYNYSIKDWYRAYVSLECDIDQMASSSIFPIVTFNKKEILSQIQKIYNIMFPDNQCSQDILNNLLACEDNQGLSVFLQSQGDDLQKVFPEINAKYILFNLRGDALGLNEPGILEYSCGESLYVETQFIFAIKAYSRITRYNACILKLLEWLNLNYTEIVMANNSPVPNWLKIEVFYNNIMYIYGTPQDVDTGEILIRILDQDGLIFKQFTIKVLPRIGEKKVGKRNKNKVKTMDKIQRNIIEKRKSILLSHSSKSFNQIDLQDENQKDQINNSNNGLKPSHVVIMEKPIEEDGKVPPQDQ